MRTLTLTNLSSQLLRIETKGIKIENMLGRGRERERQTDRQTDRQRQRVREEGTDDVSHAPSRLLIILALGNNLIAEVAYPFSFLKHLLL